MERRFSEIENSDYFQARMAGLGYGRALVGRLYNVFSRNQLVDVGGDFDGQLNGYDHFSSLQPAPYSITDQPERFAAFNKLLPQTAERMLLVGDSIARTESYIYGIGAEDIGNFTRTVDKIVKSKIEGTDHGVVMRVVFGATTEMPLRALSYILPALSYLENMQRGGLPLPQLQIVFPHHLSSQLNRMPDGVAEKEAFKLAVVARDFIDEFFPQVAESVVFMQDYPLVKGSVMRNEIIQIAQSVDENMEPEDKEDLAKKGEIHGGSRTYILYAAAHILVHDGPAGDGILQPMFEDQAQVSDPSTIISVGGKSEVRFYNLRHRVKYAVGGKYDYLINTLQFFTRHSNAPYYMAKEGDAGLAQAILDPGTRSQPTSTSAAYDLEYLEESSKHRGHIFSDFLEKEGKKLQETGFL